MKKELPETKVIVVPWNLDGKRLDVAAATLTQEWFDPALPRATVQEAIRSRTILLQGGEANPSARVSKGDHITFTENFFRGIAQKDERVFPVGEEPLVLEADEQLIALYKPAGWLTHEVANYQQEASLEDWLLKNSLIPTNLPQNGRVHRLDRNTSGVIVYAKTESAQNALKTLFQERQVTKIYLGLAEGNLSELSGTVSAPLIRKKGSFKRIIAEDLSMPGVKEATTSYRVIARTPEYDLLFLTPKTGRTHQIRVHMAHLGHPLVGDVLYGAQNELFGRQFLHAMSLNFALQGQKYRFQAPLADDLQKFLSSLDERSLTRYDNEALQSIGQGASIGFFSFIKRSILKSR